ncbi:hypothetical protein EF53_025 [Enterococcus phage 53]|uniref:Uncharacterized protein n=1 Tax=Enterococcus phage vB_Efs6_KEN16 TaxID=3138325 RepID=A0AAX4PUG7_9CAUD|nr:hypothetical protein EF53_025 [Enterococcus phage 53]
MKYPYLVELYAKHVIRDAEYIENVPPVIYEDVVKRVEEIKREENLTID